MKKLAVILLTVFLLFSAAACGKVPASTPTVSTSVPIYSSSESSSSKVSSSSNISSGSSSTTTDTEDTSSEENTYVPPTPKPLDHSAHYCYAFLNDIQKQYYNSMHTAVENMHNSWVVLGPLTDTYASDVSIVRQALVADHPDIFWLPPYHVTAAGTDSEGNPAALIMFSSSADVSPAYVMTRAEKDYMEQELTTAIAVIISQVTSSDPFEIELQLHDMLCRKVTYSADPNDPLIYTAYGALVNGSALCEGYSRAMQLLLSQFGIQATTISGVADGVGHMWNAVNIGGSWHHLDATWNDTSTGFISHEYFNLTDEEILLDHTFSKSFTELTSAEITSGTVAFNTFRPTCTSTGFNYFAKKGFIFTGENTAELAAYIASIPDEVTEIKFLDQTVKAQFTANSETVLSQLCDLLNINHNANYYIGRYSVSATALKLYKVAY